MRDRYIITTIDGKYAQLSKLPSKFISPKHTVNLSKLYSAGNMKITGHEDSDESDYEIEHNGYIQSETSKGEDRNNNKEEVEEHQNV